MNEIHMGLDEYQKLALRTADTESGKIDQLTNGLMGLNGESGECIDLLKKHLYQGHDLDCEHLEEELGDTLWYLAVSAEAIGTTLSKIAEKNVDKLKKRYPNGFDVSRSINR